MLEPDYTNLAIGGGAGGILIWIATQLPKIFASLKRDKLDGDFAATQMVMMDGLAESYNKRFHNQEEWQTKTDARLTEMNDLIHKQQVKVTRLTVVMIRLESKVKALGAEIEPDLAVEIDALRAVI